MVIGIIAVVIRGWQSTAAPEVLGRSQGRARPCPLASELRRGCRGGFVSAQRRLKRASSIVIPRKQFSALLLLF